MEKFPIGVVGDGVMGKGIAKAFLISGYPVILITKKADRIPLIKQKIPDAAFQVTTDFSHLAACRIVIEAVPEALEAKKNAIAAMSAAAPGAILASTTSSIPIGRLASFSNDPSRFIGLHFFNPAHKMPTVELIPAPQTAQEVVGESLKTIRSLGKEAVIVKDEAGFVTTRLLMAYFVEALKMIESGHDPKTIDEAMVQCVKMPMGPCALMDLIGLDVIHHILELLSADLGERFAPPSLLDDCLKSGKLGTKSQIGLFSYEGAASGGLKK